MALVHDLAESIVGDLTPSSGVSKEDKYAQEKVNFPSIYLLFFALFSPFFLSVTFLSLSLPIHTGSYGAYPNLPTTRGNIHWTVYIII